MAEQNATSCHVPKRRVAGQTTSHYRIAMVGCKICEKQDYKLFVFISRS